jgi:hypothetical protein
MIRPAILLLATAALPAIACVPHRRATPASLSTALIWPADLVLGDSADPKPLNHQLPMYPLEMQTEGRSAKLVAAYVVDTTGRVDLASVRFLLDAPRPFERAICSVLRKKRFEPLRRDGHLHPALVLEPYGFFIGGSNDSSDDGSKWTRERPDVEAARQVIERTGLPDAHAQLESRPGCA